MTKSFAELGLSPAALKAVDSLGYTTPTPVQEQAIPLVGQGHDVCAAAATGTGKTAAFLLPTMDKLGHSAAGESPRMLVVTPTRELAQQISDFCKVVCKETGHTQTTVYGGTKYGPQIKALKNGCDILIATPGRLTDLRERGALELSDIDVLVIDEADRMLDMGFWPAMRDIIAQTPDNRQTLLFSATLDRKIMNSVKPILHDPVMVEISHRGDTAATVEQYIMPIQHKKKFELLNAILQEKGHDRVIVFCRTKKRTEECMEQLRYTGYAADSIHSDKNQYKRKRALEKFEKGKVNILVATDVLARGIDVPSVDYVVNYDLPDMAEDYVHRVGRTGRAGETGYAISFVTRETRGILRDIERLINREIPIMELDTYDIDPTVLTAKEKEKHKHVRERDAERARLHNLEESERRSQGGDTAPKGSFKGLEGWHGEVKRANERIAQSGGKGGKGGKKPGERTPKKHPTKRDAEFRNSNSQNANAGKGKKDYGQQQGGRRGRSNNRRFEEETFETRGERRQLRGGAHKKTYAAKRDGMQTRPKAEQGKRPRYSEGKGKGKNTGRRPNNQGMARARKSANSFDRFYGKNGR